jgi:Domain of unknown function (DUF4136)
MAKSLIRYAAATLAAAASLAGCVSLTVRSDVNNALIGQVRCNSFAWAGSFRGNSPLRNTIANPINETRLRAAIASHLKGGAVQDAGSSADCLVGYGIGTTTVVDPAWYGYGWGYPYGWGWGWPGPYAYREGIIAVDVYDAKSRQPLWHASVDQSLYGTSGPEAQKRIDAAVAAIFTKYPG